MRYLVNPTTGELKEENAAVSLDIIAPEEETAVASRAYAEGEQFILEGKLYAATAAIASGASIVTEGAGANAEEAPNVINQIENHTPAVMTGATASADGTAGLAPQPHAGDEDKVLQGKGVWGHKLQIDVVEQNGVYGYINGSNTFVPFKSQADIDAAVTAAMVGNATAADVLAGKTFTNASASGNTGTLPNRQTNSMIVPRWGTTPGSNVPATQVATRDPRVDFGNTTTYGSAEMIEIAMPAGAYAWSYGNSSCCIPTETKTVTPSTSAQTVTPTEYNTSGKYLKFLKSVTVNAISTQEKTVTAGTSAASVTPDNGKYLSKVTYNPTPTQEKTITASRSAQTVTPDSGKHLSKVTVNKYPDANGTYTTSTRGTAVDMGTTNNYRYVNTNGVTNTNSGTYTFGSTTGATYDMGTTNTYRYVNAANVYSKGKTDGFTNAGNTMGVVGSWARDGSGTITVNLTAANTSNFRCVLMIVLVSLPGGNTSSYTITNNNSSWSKLDNRVTSNAYNGAGAFQVYKLDASKIGTAVNSTITLNNVWFGVVHILRFK